MNAAKMSTEGRFKVWVCSNGEDKTRKFLERTTTAKTIDHIAEVGKMIHRFNLWYTVYASRYPYQGCWEIDNRGFETLDEAVKYIKQCQSDGYVIIDLRCRDFGGVDDESRAN